ncbi:glycosyltransferase family 2 protein [Shewanella canadensis]|uniref:Glycosyltransferase family 2 protein n=1 Tax=Shewanella canadensis TaxID=271096 RepID=A0A431WSY7_9GAMM|nr:glycosyltransferase family 2 protein [Shewanella canadensis]RTR38254.1 glycosyltransferase family 2 protein [Shewanella canadensis]
MTIPISVFFVTKNEEEHIGKALSSVACMDEIIVVDSGSTDKTVEIAERFGAKVYSHAWMGYAKQKQYALSLCSNDWVLNLDGDEVINERLIKSLQAIIDQNTADSVRFWRNDIFIGKPLSAWSKKPNNHRFFKRDKAHFDESKMVHESATVKGIETFINETFDHYGYGSIEAITSKNNKYSSLKADEKLNRDKQFSYIKLITIFPLIFLKEYFIQRKMFSGMRGFILAIMDAYYSFIKEAKLYEHHQHQAQSQSNAEPNTAQKSAKQPK